MIELPVITQRAEGFAGPVRPVMAEAVSSDAEQGAGGADDGLSAFLVAIAAEVQGRAASARAALQGKFKGDIAHVRRTLPRDQIGAAVAVLKQSLAAALKAVKEAAGIEIDKKRKAIVAHRQACGISSAYAIPDRRVDSHSIGRKLTPPKKNVLASC